MTTPTDRFPSVSIRVHPWLLFLAAPLLALSLCLPHVCLHATESLSLAGKWRFALDRNDQGITDEWFHQTLPDSLHLPGALQNQGFGDDITTNTAWTGGSGVKQWFDLPRYEKYRQPDNLKVPFFLQPQKHYVGAAWYQRDLEIPKAWQGRRIVLTLERAHWETRAWLDDRSLGTNGSLSTPHVYDLGVGLAPGRHRLSLRVDNRLLVNVGTRAHSVSDETQGNWNGVIGQMNLTTTSPVWLDDVQVYPNVKTKSARLKIRIGNDSGKAGEGTVSVANTTVPVKWNETGGNAELEVALGNNAKLWDEFSPVLQHLQVKLHGDLADDSRDVTFGLREIAVQDRQFVLNGRPAFFRGTLECCIFPLTGYPPTEVAAWKRIIRICQEHGLNHIRFHSWCPPEAAFAAADELGFCFSIEIAAWAAIGDGAPVDAWLYAEAERMLRAYGNHPSFVMMPYGNEPAGKNRDRWLGEWVNHWKASDPRRLYTSAAGWPAIPENQYHITQTTRGIKGWFGGDYRKDLENFKVQSLPPGNPAVPVIVHEMGQWCVYPNFDEVSKYTGPLKPKNFDIFRDSLAEHGMLDRWKDFFRASGKLQVLCYKEEIEAALRTPGIGGIQLLDLHDFPGQGTALVGVLDPFWDAKSYVSAKEFRRFYNTTVPLARLRRTWTSTETLTAETEVAHFGSAPLTNAQPYWQVLAADRRVVASGEFPAQTLPIGSGNKLGTVRLSLEGPPAPQSYKFVVGLKGTPFENDWNFWVYPAVTPTPPSDVLVTGQFDTAARQRLAQGGKVLVTSAALGAGGPKLFFQPIFWNHFMFNTHEMQTLGLWCDARHPALAQFPTKDFQDCQWQDIVTSARAVVLDQLPPRLRPIVQPIDDWNTNRKLGLIFECRVGRGKLLVCAADLTANLDARPAARQLRQSLVAYAASDKFNPTVEIAESDLLTALEPNKVSKTVSK
jgi:hypothetical protein